KCCRRPRWCGCPQTSRGRRERVYRSNTSWLRATHANPCIAMSAAIGQCVSILRLLRRLVDPNLDREHLADPDVARAAQRAASQVVQSDRDAHMRIGGANPVGRIESHPAELGHERLAPGVAGILIVQAIVLAQIAADIARRDAERAGSGDEDVGKVLTDPALEREG